MEVAELRYRCTFRYNIIKSVIMKMVFEKNG